ncbi:hypothetical protein CPB85DRAFT_1563226 [Mucidula mucida]|nr:hypothetical protein CPB85DRAFT_1563226 [Mucidula mucida]
MPRKSTRSVPTQSAPTPRLIRAAPKTTTSSLNTGEKRALEEASTDSDSPPPPAKKLRTLKESSNANAPAIPDLSSIPNPKTFRSHPRYDDYVKSIPRPVKGGSKSTKEEHKKNFENDWSVARLVGRRKVKCVGCWSDKTVNGYQPAPWVNHRERCSALMAKWMVKAGFATEGAARCAGITFEEPKSKITSS